MSKFQFRGVYEANVTLPGGKVALVKPGEVHDLDVKDPGPLWAPVTGSGPAGEPTKKAAPKKATPKKARESKKAAAAEPVVPAAVTPPAPAPVVEPAPEPAAVADPAPGAPADTAPTA